VSIAAAVRSFSRQRGWRVQGVNASTLAVYLSSHELPAHFAELDSSQRKADSRCCSNTAASGDASIWLAAPLEQWFAPAFEGGARLVAFTTLDRLVEYWFLGAARRNAVIRRWRGTFIAELDAAAFRATRNRSAIGTELRASALWHSTDTAGIDIDCGYLHGPHAHSPAAARRRGGGGVRRAHSHVVLECWARPGAQRQGA
jgi:hypothetical protein